MSDAHTLTREQVIGLLEERDMLREQVRQLQAALVAPVVLPKAWGLTAKEELLLRAIRAAGPNLLHHERALLSLYDLWEDMPQQKIVDVMISRIRRKIREARLPFQIDTVWGRGWRMSAESCAAFDAALSADQARWPGMGRAAA